MRLDKLQRNQLFRTLEAAGLDPNAFELREPKDGPAGLVHVRSYAAFKFRRRTAIQRWWSGTSMSFTVTSNLPEASIKRWGVADWPDVVEATEEWARDLKEDLSTPDFWRELRPIAETGESSRNSDNSRFDETEQDEIAAYVASVKSEAQSTYDLSDPQLKNLEDKLDYLVDASKRVGRLDWRNLAAGVFLDMAREAVLPQSTTLRIFQHLATAVSHMLGHPLQLGP